MALIDELHVVRRAVPLPDCTLLLEFEDGSLRVIDLSCMRNEPGVLPRLADQAFFEQVRVDEEAGTVVWPDDIDLDPDVLYHESTPVRPDTVRDLIAQARQRP